MQPNYQVASPYLRLMLQADQRMYTLLNEARGIDLNSVLKADYVSGDVINQIFEVLQAQGVESWVIQYADHLGVGSHGPLSFAALSAPNLRSAIDVVANFSSIRSSGTQVQLRQNDQRLEYVLRDLTQRTLVGRWLIESNLLVIQRLIEAIIAHPLGAYAEIHFAYPKPADHRAIDRLFNTQCKYAAQESYLSIPSSWGEISSPLSDPDLYRSNLAKCRELKLALETSKADVTHVVQTRLLNHFDRRLSKQARLDKIPNLDVLAAQLFMSPRTLIRKLSAQGTSFREILEQVRQNQAEHLLSNTYFTVAEISGLLGYQEPANFTRAF
ncbi:MAG: AraC-like DNA-binding protein, partial [Arenicella sp.]